MCAHANDLVVLRGWVAQSAFAWCGDLKSVTIPDSVTSIGQVPVIVSLQPPPQLAWARERKQMGCVLPLSHLALRGACHILVVWRGWMADGVRYDGWHHAVLLRGRANRAGLRRVAQ